MESETVIGHTHTPSNDSVQWITIGFWSLHTYSEAIIDKRARFLRVGQILGHYQVGHMIRGRGRAIIPITQQIAEILPPPY